MTHAETLERGRESFSRMEWAEAYRLLRAADRERPLEPEDLVRLGMAAYLIGKDDELEEFLPRAHEAMLERADFEGAARAAFWLGFGLLARGAMAPAAGWLARAERVLDEQQIDCAVRGYLLVPTAIQCIVQGDAAAAHDTFAQAAAIASRFGDRSLSALACQGRGRALIRLGRVSEGVGLLDEAMVAVTAGEVIPLLAGDIYCSVLEACQEIFDVRRAHEWTTSLSRWCATQPDLVRYRGECRSYRAEVLQLRGKWHDAEADVQEACALLTTGLGRAAAGAAFYRLGEIHRVRGEFDRAEAAYARATEYRKKPQPGLSLLRLAQGQPDVAAASMRDALAATTTQAARARLLPAAVEILLAVADSEQARAAAEELSGIAAAFGTPLLSAASACATGRVLIAGGDLAAASTWLRQACDTWRDLEMPYEQGQTCLLIADVCRRRGDEDGHRFEREAGRRLLAQLDTGRAVAPAVDQPKPRAAGGLSDREAQVLRLIASGKTNRAIADELFISEKTVARHVSNIFDKLDISTRAAATAWAYQHHLV
jgi:DNA-binding CsgD family transcriptional regulator